MNWDIMSFLTIVIFVFAIVMVIAGIFSAYFGSGKSRTYGIVMLVTGIIVFVIWAFLVGWSNIELFAEVPALDLMIESLITFLAIMLGALIAVGIFLVAVLKS
ncbi:MAG TPA: hypothetical protein VJY42_00040 [Candidatus Methanomethylophilaceae archaeon]|nr:hypothetical protein [Candidatus Methanomethylophilaceae archaeon]